MLPTDEQLAQIDDCLRYDSESGDLFWRVDRRRRSAGERAGGIYHGSWHVTVAGMLLHAEDVAWFLGHGEWPPARVVWLNGVVSDNRLDNLTLSDDPARGVPVQRLSKKARLTRIRMAARAAMRRPPTASP